MREDSAPATDTFSPADSTSRTKTHLKRLAAVEEEDEWEDEEDDDDMGTEGEDGEDDEEDE